jgi:hypothetical protein
MWHGNGMGYGRGMGRRRRRRDGRRYMVMPFFLLMMPEVMMTKPVVAEEPKPE